MVQKGDFIRITYTGRLDSGEVFDTTDEETAKANNIHNENKRYGGEVVILGAKHTLAGMEDELEGKEAGYSGKVTIPPENAFGRYDAALIQDIPITRFPDKPQSGQRVVIDGKYATVHVVMGRHVRVDFNHPIAGKTVTYDYTIEQKLESPEDKISGLLEMYAGNKFKIEVSGDTASVEVPLALALEKQWLVAKALVATDMLKYGGIKELVFIERFTQEALNPAKPA
ncbi:MAG TPA: peptidylprolyl isomerase [Candidatus Methanoperedenaceae archaeon]|nr:peptidylprolyl isomerase [Candidatus Methanoperedenaceae archaeon]